MPTIHKRAFHSTLLVTLAVAVLIAACAAPAATEPATAPTTGPSQPARPAPAMDSPTLVATAPGEAPTQPAASGPVSFSRDLIPIFNETCIKCHGGEKTEKGLDMKSYAALLAGSERGAVVVPGDAGGSKLAQLVQNGKMPKRGPKLSSEQVQLIVDWINAGAQNN